MPVFRAPRPAWTRPPPNVIGVSEPTRTAFLFSQGDQRVRGATQGDPMGPNPAGTAAAVVTTKYGRGYEMADGNRSIVSENNTFNLGHYSVSFLARIDSIDSSYGTLFSWTNSAGNSNRIMLYRNNTADSMLMTHRFATGGAVCTATELADGVWGWTTIVYDGANVTLYKNGEYVNQGALTTDPSTSVATDKLKLFGHRADGSANETLGQIAAFYALDRAMTPSEIRHRHSPQGQWDWLRTSPQRFIETSAASATGVNAALLMAITTGVTPTATSDYSGLLGLGVTATVTQSVNADRIAALTFAAQLSAIYASDQDIDAALTFASSLGVSQTVLMDAHSALNLGVDVDLALIAGLDLSASLLLAASVSEAMVGDITIEAALLLAATATVAQSAAGDLEGALNLATSMGFTASAIADMEGALGIGATAGYTVIGPIVTDAGLSLSASMGTTFAGVTGIIEITTTDGRLIRLAAGDRSILIEVGDRTIEH